MTYKGKVNRRLLQHPAPKGKRANTRIQRKLLTLCFNYLKRREYTTTLSQLRKQAAEDFNGADVGEGSVRASRIQERYYRLCFHWVRDKEPEVLKRLRAEAERGVLGGDNHGQ